MSSGTWAQPGPWHMSRAQLRYMSSQRSTLDCEHFIWMQGRSRPFEGPEGFPTQKDGVQGCCLPPVPTLSLHPVTVLVSPPVPLHTLPSVSVCGPTPPPHSGWPMGTGQLAWRRPTETGVGGRDSCGESQNQGSDCTAWWQSLPTSLHGWHPE